MKYPEKFITAELIKKNSEELSAIADALWEDWSRVNNALSVVKSMERQTKEASEE
tara:strand:+ start:14050 stop:14214 length:165 start_codon:yes stop_codon:yes gene_type:complete